MLRTSRFKTHEASESHKEALQMLVVVSTTCPNIGKMLLGSMPRKKVKIVNAFFKYYPYFLARQGLAFKGGVEGDSNFMQLLKLYSSAPRMEIRLLKKMTKYTSNNAQNESH